MEYKKFSIEDWDSYLKNFDGNIVEFLEKINPIIQDLEFEHNGDINRCERIKKGIEKFVKKYHFAILEDKIMEYLEDPNHYKKHLAIVGMHIRYVKKEELTVELVRSTEIEFIKNYIKDLSETEGDRLEDHILIALKGIEEKYGAKAIDDQEKILEHNKEKLIYILEKICKNDQSNISKATQFICDNYTGINVKSVAKRLGLSREMIKKIKSKE